jgi:ATP-dependent Zn protease
MARDYVMTYGMSGLGIISVDSRTRLSPNMAARIDEELQALIKRLTEKTYAIISVNIELIKKIALQLQDQKTILADQWYNLSAGAICLEDLTTVKSDVSESDISGAA